MSTTKTTDTHTCSCGRSFASAQTLKYHQRVSRHTEVDASPEVDASAPVAVVQAAIVAAAAEVVVDADLAYRQAIEILGAKRAQQEAYERSLAATQAVNEFVDFAGDLAATGGKLAAKLIFALLIFIFTAGIITAGVGLGTTVASVGGSGTAMVVSPAAAHAGIAA